MATYYTDVSAATNGAGTEADPYNAVPTITTGNTYLFKAGVNIGAQITVAADTVTIGSYGAGRAIINGASTLNYGVYGTGISGVTVQDLEIFSVLKNGVLIENDGASTTKTSIKIQRCKIYNILPSGLLGNTEQNIRIGTGILVGSGPTTGLAVISGVDIDDNEIYDCGRFGIDVRWRVLNVNRRRNHVYRTGSQIGAHGISSHPIATTFSSSWTLDSGTIYSRARVSTNDVEQYMADVTNVNMLTKVAGTTPASGQWSVDATKIYVNIGGSVTGVSFILKRHIHGPFRDEDNVVHDVYTFGGLEGHGIDTDDASGPVTMVRCVSYNNQGAGFYSYRGDNIRRESCLAYGNAGQGFLSLLIDTPLDYGNTAAANGARGFQWDGGVNGQAKNCLAYGNATTGSPTTGTGFNVGSTHAGFASATNAVYGNGGTTQVAGTGAAASIMADPLLTASYRPMAGSPLIGAGMHLGYTRDLDKKQRQNPPCIGAYDLATMRVTS